jgi:hypothetical protein
MTESEWLTCEDWSLMLPQVKRRLSNRKAKLFCCACCRWRDDLLTNLCRRWLDAVELSETTRHAPD